MKTKKTKKTLIVDTKLYSYLLKVIPVALVIISLAFPVFLLTNCKSAGNADSQISTNTSELSGTYSDQMNSINSSESLFSNSINSEASLENPESSSQPSSSTKTSATSSMSVASKPSGTPSPSITQPREEIMEYTKFNFNTYMKPFWSGNIVYNETLMFIRDVNGNIEPAPLLYKPTEIIAVRSYDLTKEYKSGTDYTVENGCIVLKPDTTIFRWVNRIYYPSVYKEGQMFGCTKGGYLLYAEATTFTRTQIAVTYRHAGTWTGLKPTYQGVKIPKTITKLKNKEDLKILFYGDSITVGCNASGWSGTLSEPRMPTWTNLVLQDLKSKYGYTKITSENTAVGGTTSTWGLQNVKSLVIDKKPDLVFLAFGMNDGSLDKYTFKQNIFGIINAVRSSNPDAEFVLVSTTLPNKEAAGFYLNQYQYESVLNEIASEIQGTAVAPMTSMHTYLLTHKRFYDMTGNNINHPNDFLVRMYAQTISRIMNEN